MSNTLTEQEMQAVGVMVAELAVIEREDMIGAILKSGAFRCLSDSDGAVVALPHKLEGAYGRARERALECPGAGLIQLPSDSRRSRRNDLPRTT